MMLYMLAMVMMLLLSLKKPQIHKNVIVTMVPLRMRKRLSQKMIQMKMVAYWNKLKQCQ